MSDPMNRHRDGYEQQKAVRRARGRMSRNKGARAEREVKQILRERGYANARRVLAGDGEQGTDILGGPEGYLIEVKWWSDEAAAVRQGWRQVRNEGDRLGFEPALWVRRTGVARGFVVVTRQQPTNPSALYVNRPTMTILEALDRAHSGMGVWAQWEDLYLAPWQLWLDEVEV